jgi:NOL1/NOP2/fmu family ribosome biogenesis protein
MFKKEVNAIPEWSEENVQKCAVRQEEILECAQKMLKNGGRMVYSTCTFSREEDEGQIQNFLSEHPEFTLITQKKLYPHKERGEGHFAALLQKNGEEDCVVRQLTPQIKDKKLLSLYQKFEKDYLKITFKNLHLIGETLYSLPDDMPKISAQTLRAGVRLGDFKNGRFEPSHSLAMCLKSGQATFIELDDKLVNLYLTGNVFDCDENISGWAVAAYHGFPLGWCKAVNGIAKNHLPKGLRI